MTKTLTLDRELIIQTLNQVSLLQKLIKTLQSDYEWSCASDGGSDEMVVDKIKLTYDTLKQLNDHLVN